MNINRYNGFLNIYKESGWTSMDVCAKLRRVLHMKKIGHAGTLDPMAEGVLPVALGRATKDVDRVGDGTKTYEAGMLLGLETDTEDVTGKPVGCILNKEHKNAEDQADRPDSDPKCPDLIEKIEQLPGDTWPSETKIREAILSFAGSYEQLTPMYSARKVNGKKLYQYARAGIEVERKTRRVEISDIEILKVNAPHVRFRVSCTKGTYIRTLCRDIGERLGCGACMESLTRTRVGDFTADTALRIAEIETLEEEGAIDQKLLIKAPTAISIGKFDGTHTGHQALLKELMKVAQEERLRTCVLILKFGSTGVLTDEERKQKLYDLGIDYCIELPFTEEMKNMSAEDFLEKILIGRYHMKAIVAGDDVSFGKGKRGDAAFLRAHANELGYRVRLIEKIKINFAAEARGDSAIDALIAGKQNPVSSPKLNGALPNAIDTSSKSIGNNKPESGSRKDADAAEQSQDISSTLLRAELSKGDMIHVTRLLGSPYAITGEVVHGKHLGTDRMQIPTINIPVPKELILPPKGVYAVRAKLADERGSFERSEVLEGIANLGTRPTVDKEGNETIMLETHLFSYEGDCYGRLARIELCFYIRQEERFESLEALKTRLKERDIPAAESFFEKLDEQGRE